MFDPKPETTTGSEIERLRAALARCANLAGMCRIEMQGRMLEDEHKRAFHVLGAIQLEALGGNDE